MAHEDARVRGITEGLSKLMKDQAQNILSELIDDAVLGVVFEVHRAARLGLVALEDGVPDENHSLVEAPDVDVFGQPPLKKQHECVCPSCHRSLAASRFAPHLEKCMGMGRNSSRIASRRIANSSKEGSGTGSGNGGGFVAGLLSDDDDDADWTMDGKERKRKRRDHRHLGKRNKSNKVKNGGEMLTQGPSSSCLGASAEGLVVPVAPEPSQPGLTAAATAPLSYDSLGPDERRSLLVQMCGVVSEHTGKLCTRSLRCPQHSDDQRRVIRMSLLGPQYAQEPDAIQPNVPMEQDALVLESEAGAVDVDSYEDGDGQAVREALARANSWEQEHSSTSSPADSTSTSSSSSKKPSTKSKKSKPKTLKTSTPPSGYTGVPGPEESYTAMEPSNRR